MSNDFLLAAVLIVLIAIAVLLALLLRKQQNITCTLGIQPSIDEVINRLDRAVSHYADVNAVVAMIEQLDEHPGAIEQLQEYPEAVRTAAWLHYINILGSDLQAAQRRLSNAHQGKLHYTLDQQYAIRSAQADVESIRAKLDTAIADSGQKVGPRVV